MCVWRQWSRAGGGGRAWGGAADRTIIVRTCAGIARAASSSLAFSPLRQRPCRLPTPLATMSMSPAQCGGMPTSCAGGHEPTHELNPPTDTDRTHSDAMPARAAHDPLASTGGTVHRPVAPCGPPASAVTHMTARCNTPRPSRHTIGTQCVFNVFTPGNRRHAACLHINTRGKPHPHCAPTLVARGVAWQSPPTAATNTHRPPPHTINPRMTHMQPCHPHPLTSTAAAGAGYDREGICYDRCSYLLAPLFSPSI